MSSHGSVCLDSAQRRFVFDDHFLGANIADEWRQLTSGTGTITLLTDIAGGVARLDPQNTIGHEAYLYWNDIRSLYVSKRVTMEARARNTVTGSTRFIMELRFDGNNKIQIILAETAPNKRWTTWSGGVSTFNEFPWVFNTDWHIYRMECHLHGGVHIHFFIDGSELTNSPATTNICAVAMQALVYCYCEATAGPNEYADVDYVVVRQDR